MEKGLYLSIEQYRKTEEEKRQMAKVSYASAIGSLMYVMMCIRPGIYFAVSMVSRYQSNLGTAYWAAVKKIHRHLKGTTNMASCYQGRRLKLIGYTDADSSIDRDESKSTSDYVFILG